MSNAGQKIVTEEYMAQFNRAAKFICAVLDDVDLDKVMAAKTPTGDSSPDRQRQIKECERASGRLNLAVALAIEDERERLRGPEAEAIAQAARKTLHAPARGDQYILDVLATRVFQLERTEQPERRRGIMPVIKKPGDSEEYRSYYEILGRFLRGAAADIGQRPERFDRLEEAKLRLDVMTAGYKAMTAQPS